MVSSHNCWREMRRDVNVVYVSFLRKIVSFAYNFGCRLVLIFHFCVFFRWQEMEAASSLQCLVTLIGDLQLEHSILWNSTGSSLFMLASDLGELFFLSLNHT